MEWFSTLSLALGTAWTSGINLYATVTVLGLLEKFGATKLPRCVRMTTHRIQQPFRICFGTLSHGARSIRVIRGRVVMPRNLMPGGAYALPKISRLQECIVRAAETTSDAIVQAHEERCMHIANLLEHAQQRRHDVGQLIDALSGDPVDQVDIKCQRD